jgi:DNA-binding GntR family transcriptional regulator
MPTVSASKQRLRASRYRDEDWDDADLSLSDRAYKVLEELIITRELAPGAVFSESALTARLKIGRTPVREALQRLEFDGLVQVLPRRGILVSEMNVQTQLKMLEVRRQLEGLVVRLAVSRSTDSERQHFRAVADGLEEAAQIDDGIAFMRVDREFNELLTSAAQNEFLHKAMGLMHGLSRRFWFSYYEEVADLPLCARLHAEVARAIADGDEPAAAAASDRLSDFIVNFTRAALDARTRRPSTKFQSRR